tara:strand:- start:3244 stop:3591 length:348 start_codon:yes stop_codon:yes gene_type:complete
MIMENFDPSSISFTRAAINHFKNSLVGKPDNFGIRIGVKEAGCSGYEYFFEYTNEKRDDDILFNESSCKIHVDNQSFEFLKGSEVDFVSSGLNQGIIFNNPNAKVTCGCGESFSI